MPPATQILIVEDEADIRAALCALLTAQGFGVTSARDGREALAMMRAGPRPDLIVLDLMMPVMNGAEFRAAQLEDPELASIPVVVTTAALGPRHIPPTLSASAVLPKPFEIEDLVGAIRRFLVPPLQGAMASA